MSSTSVSTPTSLRRSARDQPNDCGRGHSRALRPVTRRRKVVGGAGGGTGFAGQCKPAVGEVAPCTLAPPPSRRSPCRSTSGSRTFATPSCPPCRRSTGSSGCRCWSTGSPAVHRHQCVGDGARDARRRRAGGAHSRPGRADVRRQRARSTNGRSPLLHRDHRSGDGACVRATWLKVVPDQLEPGRSTSTGRPCCPEIEQLDGFCSASLMVDHRRPGGPCPRSTFDSLDAMDAQPRPGATELRSARVRDLGADVIDVGEFELAIARLRVPETASRATSPRGIRGRRAPGR